MTLVVMLHAAIIHALASGMATRIVNAIHLPIETKVIPEHQEPPPPPEISVAPPEFQPPAPPFIPPPEVRIAVTPPVQDTITVLTQTLPSAPIVIAPLLSAITAAPPVAAPAANVEPALPSVAPVHPSVVCSNHATVMGDAAYPREAMRAGINKGSAVIQFTVGPNGQVKDISVIRASSPIFARSSVGIVAQYKCQGLGHDVRIEVPMDYRLE